MSRTVIYLCEIAHDGFGLSLRTIPLGVGVVGAYCKKVHGDVIELL